jgi:hypothetical protein
VPPANGYRQLPAASRQRGLPPIGVELEAPAAVEVTPIDSGPTLVRCRERRADGKTIGELEIAIFKAALVIDRDGILEAKASTAANDVADRGVRVSSPMPVSLHGASGYRADAEIRPPPPLPYAYVFAMAPNDLGVDGGVLVTIRCATPEWPAADEIIESLRLSTRRGASNDAEPAAPLLPMLGRRDDE